LGSLAFFLAVGLFSIVGLILSLAALGFTIGLTMSVPPTLLAEAFAEERATAIGIYNFVRYAGMAAAPLLGSLFYETGGIWLLFGCTAVLMGWAILYAKKLWHTMPA
jgi:MFS family permease